jgi:hypothetical protein
MTVQITTARDLHEATTDDRTAKIANEILG